MKKKILSLALALTVCLGLLPATALAAGSFSIDGSNVLTKYNGPGGHVTIPDGVTAIGSQAFYGRADVTGVTIPNSVTAIESPLMGNRGAFGGCTGLTSIELPGSITQIGSFAFSGCTGLTSVVIPDSVTNLGRSVFQDCTGLTSAVVGSGLKDAGWSVFSGCSSLSSVTLKEGLTSIPDHMFNRCTSLTSVKIPNSVTDIGGSAFYGCSNLSSVDFGNRVWRLGMGTFGRCAKLKEVTLPASLQRVDNIAFRDIDSVTTAGGPTELKSITYAEGTTTIPVVASPTVTEVHVPASVTAVQDGAFDSYSDLTVYGVAGSYMESWCSMRGIPFVGAAGPKPTTPPAAGAEDIPASGTAVASTQAVEVDGRKIEFQMYALLDANGNGTNYVKLRDLAHVLNGTRAQFSVGYDSATGITVTSGQPYVDNGSEMNTPFSGDRAYTGGGQSVQVNGQAVELTAINLLDDNGGGYNYFKLRDLGRALGFNVSWSAQRGIFVETGKPYVG